MTLSINTFSKSLTIDTHYARTPAAFPVNIAGSAVNINIVDTSGANSHTSDIHKVDFWTSKAKTNYVNRMVNGSFSVNSSLTSNNAYAQVDTKYNGNNWIKNSDINMPDLFGPTNTVNYKVSSMNDLYSGGPVQYGLMTEFVIDNTAYDDPNYWNFYNSDIINDGDSGEITFAGNKPQNWGFLYFGVAYQDMNSTNINASRGGAESDTLATSNYQIFLDFDDYPEYSTDLARRFHSYTYTGYSASNTMGYRYSRTGNNITLESFNPSNGSAIYNRTVTVDPAEDTRLFLAAMPSSSLVAGTYDVLSQSGTPEFRDVSGGPIQVSTQDHNTFEFPEITSMDSGNFTGILGETNFVTSKTIDKTSYSNSSISINSVPTNLVGEYTSDNYKTEFWVGADKGQTSKTQADARTVTFFIVNEADIMFLDKDGIQTFEQVTPFNDPIPPVDSTTGVNGGSGGGTSGPVQTWF